MYWSHYSENLILQTFNAITATAPTTVYAACFINNPTNAGTGTEISYAGYQRVPITFTTPAANSTGVSMQNATDLLFATSATAANSITYLALYDSPSAGNFLAYVALDEPLAIHAGVAPLISAGEVNFETRGNFSQSFKTKCLHFLRGTTLHGFNTYLSLYNGDPDNGGAELSGINYARTPLTFHSPAVQASGQTMISNSADVVGNKSGDNWGSWSYTAFMDSVSGGDSVAFIQEGVTTIMGKGKAVMIDTGALTVSLS